jgi:hypothetical protein
LGLTVSKVAFKLMMFTSQGSAGAEAGSVAVSRLPLKVKIVPLSPEVMR